MSKEMLELADAFEEKGSDILFDLSAEKINLIVDALRASAVAEPVGFACSAEIGVNRHHLGLSVEQMGVYDTPVYAHPTPAPPVPNLQGKLAGSPAAPFPASVRDEMREMGAQHDPIREALRRMLAEFGDEHYHTCPADKDSGPCDCFAGALIASSRAALASLPEPEAATSEPDTVPETCSDCGSREPCDDDCPNYAEPSAAPEAAPTREEIAKRLSVLVDAVTVCKFSPEGSIEARHAAQDVDDAIDEARRILALKSAPAK